MNSQLGEVELNLFRAKERYLRFEHLVIAPFKFPERLLELKSTISSDLHSPETHLLISNTSSYPLHQVQVEFDHEDYCY